MYHVLFIPSSVNQNWDYFYLWVVFSCKRQHVHKSVYVDAGFHLCFGEMLKSGIVESLREPSDQGVCYVYYWNVRKWSKCSLKFLHLFLSSPVVSNLWEFWLLTVPVTFVTVHCSRCELWSHCNLHLIMANKVFPWAFNYLCVFGDLNSFYDDF